MVVGLANNSFKNEEDEGALDVGLPNQFVPDPDPHHSRRHFGMWQQRHWTSQTLTMMLLFTNQQQHSAEKAMAIYLDAASTVAEAEFALKAVSLKWDQEGHGRRPEWA